MPPETKLANLIVDAATRRARGEHALTLDNEVAHLVIALGAEGDAAFGRFFDALASELKRRHARLPPIDDLPPSVAPLLSLFEHSFAYDARGELDIERTAGRMDASLVAAFGTSPRKIREAELEAEIRKDVSASVAESLRQHGLVPACDTKLEIDPT